MIKDPTTDTIYQVIMKHYHQPDISATEKQFYAYVLKCFFANPQLLQTLRSGAHLQNQSSKSTMMHCKWSCQEKTKQKKRN